MKFVYEALPGRVIFGPGRLASVADEAALLGLRRALVISTPEQRGLAEQVAGLLGDRVAAIHDRAVMHVPVETAEEAMQTVTAASIDGCVAIGGGSTVGLAKAIALETGLPILAIPTTYAGSEMTPVWGLTRDGIKSTGRDRRVLPKTVIYDPELTLSLPATISGPSGMNAIAHCVEGLYSQTRNPVISLMAEEGIRALGESLPAIASDSADIEARGQAQYGAWLAGAVLGAVGMAVHHKLCHTLGGSFNLPHAPVHTVMIPHATWFNRDHAPEAMAAIGRALGVPAEEAAGALYDLAVSIEAPISLEEIGMAEADLDRAAEIATTNPYYNPRPVDRAGIRALLDDAYHGVRPGAARA